MKVCNSPDCAYRGQPQPTENFYKNAYSPDGLHSICKDCKNRHTRLRYHSKEASQILFRELGRIKRKRSYKRYIDKHPEKVRAHDAVKYMVKKGKIPKPTDLICSNCGKQAEQYHHHNGYSKEHKLDVIPLCRTCHYSVHQKIN